MKHLKYAEILAKNRELSALPAGCGHYRIALLSNIVVSQLKDILEFMLRRRGINAVVTLGEYDNIVQDSLRFGEFDAVIVFWETANLIDSLHAVADAMDAGDLNSLAERFEGEIKLALKNLSRVPLVLFNRFTATAFCRNELRDGALRKLCARLNAALEQNAASHQLLIDLERIIAMLGLASVSDFRQFHSSKALYSLDFLKAYAEHIEPAFRSINGQSKKVLVLDCDGTLWAGVLGEDGETGIRMNDSTREGKIFREVQCILKGFRRKGVLLAICSKNNPDDVSALLARHSDMVLRGSDFAAQKINWNDKATNLRDMARELNLGLESFVFVDDSAFELGLVAEALPQVLCVQVPNALSEYPAAIRRLEREFFTLSTTQEDLLKTDMYLMERERKSSISEFASIDDYLRSLKLIVRVDWNGANCVNRAAQMTQKTNQFNLTTYRYTESDIHRMLSNPCWSMATFSVSDRYGDYGVTGLAIIKLDEQRREATINSYLLSCRVLGRNLERVVFDYLVDKLMRRGVSTLHGEYIKTGKNHQVADFFDILGFTRHTATDGRHGYTLSLGDYRSSGIDYIEVLENAD
ncbi:HAD-IIIC family phosphatase [Methylogaea oryzae]|uniref:HAD-IIIC family phosphatase n=1 Tax=Methylogaea oryzae TaxID=1295382 RepID=A0A8D5AKN9_9GAMM|nr:HAD-IIIC family phosphatase [Methylogaea oryzae]BBL71326.1 hypothetical protein MoryE10_19320 [Methylogaea oryzae]